MDKLHMQARLEALEFVVEFLLALEMARLGGVEVGRAQLEAAGVGAMRDDCTAEIIELAMRARALERKIRSVCKTAEKGQTPI